MLHLAEGRRTASYAAVGAIFRAAKQAAASWTSPNGEANEPRLQSSSSISKASSRSALAAAQPLGFLFMSWWLSSDYIPDPLLKSHHRAALGLGSAMPEPPLPEIAASIVAIECLATIFAISLDMR